MLTLQGHQVFLRDQRTRFHLATTHHIGNQPRQVVVVSADKATVAHIDQGALDRRDARAAGDREQRFHRRAVARIGHRLDLGRGDEQQLVFVRHEHVAVEEEAVLFSFQRRGRDLGRGRCRETVFQEGKDVRIGVACLGHLGGAAGDVGQAAGTGDQADAHLDQSHVRLHVDDTARAMHGQLATTPQGETAHRGDDRHRGVTDAQHRVLQLLLFWRDALGTRLHEDRHQRLEVGTGREHIVRRPDHQALVVRFGDLDGLQQAFGHRRTDQVQLGSDGGDQDLAVQRPDAHFLVLELFDATLQRLRRAFAEQRFREGLALVDRQLGARLELALGGAPRAVLGMHAAVVGNRAF